MAKLAKELSALAVSKLKDEGVYAVGGVAGLCLRVKDTGSRSWILRVKVGSKRKEIGLGAFPAVPLAEAREAARAHRKAIGEGIDPVEKKQAAKKALQQEQNKPTFAECVDKYLPMRAPEWSNDKHAKQWRSTLEKFAYPIIGKRRVDQIEQSHILQILQPIWLTKTETAVRLRGRIEAVLDWAAAHGYRSKSFNPARFKGQLENLLQKVSKVKTVEHQPALPFEQIGMLVRDLNTRSGMAAKALKFAILNASRSVEVRGAKWSEIDLQEKAWTIPANRMKARVEHRVPLSAEAVKLLESLDRMEGSEFVFYSPTGKALSDMALSAVVRQMNEERVKDGLEPWIDPKTETRRWVVPHGFRSTFSDWAAERTNFPRHVVEMALAHTIENKVEAAYRRGELFEKRVKLMDAWSQYCATVEKPAKVLPLEKKVV